LGYKSFDPFQTFGILTKKLAIVVQW